MRQLGVTEETWHHDRNQRDETQDIEDLDRPYRTRAVAVKLVRIAFTLATFFSITNVARCSLPTAKTVTAAAAETDGEEGNDGEGRQNEGGNSHTTDGLRVWDPITITTVISGAESR